MLQWVSDAFTQCSKIDRTLVCAVLVLIGLDGFKVQLMFPRRSDPDLVSAAFDRVTPAMVEVTAHAASAAGVTALQHGKAAVGGECHESPAAVAELSPLSAKVYDVRDFPILSVRKMHGVVMLETSVSPLRLCWVFPDACLCRRGSAAARVWCGEPPVRSPPLWWPPPSWMPRRDVAK